MPESSYKIIKPLVDDHPFYDHSNVILRVVVKEGFSVNTDLQKIVNKLWLMSKNCCWLMIVSATSTHKCKHEHLIWWVHILEWSKQGAVTFPRTSHVVGNVKKHSGSEFVNRQVRKKKTNALLSMRLSSYMTLLQIKNYEAGIKSW